MTCTNLQNVTEILHLSCENRRLAFRVLYEEAGVFFFFFLNVTEDSNLILGMTRIVVQIVPGILSADQIQKTIDVSTEPQQYALKQDIFCSMPEVLMRADFMVITHRQSRNRSSGH